MNREEVIPILRVVDAEASPRWYEQLGFELTDVHRSAPGLPRFAMIQPDFEIIDPDGNRLRINTPSWW